MHKLLFLILILQTCLVNSFLFVISASTIIILAANYFKCTFNECCDIYLNNSKNSYVKFNIEYELKSALNNKIVGQHILIDVLPKAINEHRNNKYPNNPLVISLHGWTGTGKTYTSEIVANILYEKGINSFFVKKITPWQFLINENLKFYKEELIDILKGQINICPRSLIIIEEIDKFHPELIEIISSFINNSKENSNFMIYLFTCNTGSNIIVDFVYKHYLEGKEREIIKLKDLESIIRNVSFNDYSGLKHNSLISSHLISHYIPFLPLERKHIKFCIQTYLKTKNYYYNESIFDEVISNIEWWPNNLKLYSTSGCKQVWNKVDILL